MGRYRRLSFRERDEFSCMLAAGHSFRRTARAMQRVPSTLSRDLMHYRICPSTNRAVSAHHRAQRGARRPRRVRKLAAQQRLRTADPITGLHSAADCLPALWHQPVRRGSGETNRSPPRAQTR